MAFARDISSFRPKSLGSQRTPPSLQAESLGKNRLRLFLLSNLSPLGVRRESRLKVDSDGLDNS